MFLRRLYNAMCMAWVGNNPHTPARFYFHFIVISNALWGIGYFLQVKAIPWYREREAKKEMVSKW